MPISGPLNRCIWGMRRVLGFPFIWASMLVFGIPQFIWASLLLILGQAIRSFGLCPSGVLGFDPFGDFNFFNLGWSPLPPNLTYPCQVSLIKHYCRAKKLRRCTIMSNFSHKDQNFSSVCHRKRNNFRNISNCS